MILFIIASILSPQASAFTLNCNFTLDNFGNYACNPMNTSVTDISDRFVTSITGTHQRGKNNGIVGVFYSNSSTFKFIPNGLKNVFPNLNVIVIQNGNLQEIYEFDLNQFGDDLLELWLHGNKLQALDYNIFKYTPNLQFLDLSANRIKFVQDGIFDSLINLQFLGFDSNPCYSGFTGIDDGFDNLVRNIEIKCKDTAYIIHKSNQALLENFNKALFQLNSFAEQIQTAIEEIPAINNENIRNIRDMLVYVLDDINNHIDRSCKSDSESGNSFIASKLQQLQVLVAFRCFPGFNGNGIDSIEWK